MIAVSEEVLGFACEMICDIGYLLDNPQSTKSSLEVLLH